MSENSSMARTEVTIEQVTLEQINELAAIGRRTFSDSFSYANTEDNMKAYLDENFSTPKIEQELNDPGSYFFFAKWKNKIAGYVKVNLGKAQTDIKDQNGLEIERIYVLTEYQGRNIGKVLFETALKIAAERKVDFVWLGVWENNHDAIRFYEKMGFVEFDTHSFMLGDDRQTDIMMKLEITKG